MSTVLVTGGAGFIGSHLADKLQEQNHNVVIIDNLSTGNINNIPHHNLIVRDINDNLDDIFSKYQFDYVFHTAAFINLRDSIKHPQICATSNILGSMNLIKYCNQYKVKKIVFSSTGGAIYSETSPLPWTEYSSAEPSSPYGLSKLNIEQYLKINYKLHKLPYSILRYSNVYGPRQNVLGEAGVIAIFIDNLLLNKNIKIFGSGNQERDFIYVDDVVNANLEMMLNDTITFNETYNVSSFSSISVNNIADVLSMKINSFSQKEYHAAIVGELLLTKLDNTKLISETNWIPSVSFDEGINKTIKSLEGVNK
jgi:UDP-glucose 4-epimerase